MWVFPAGRYARARREWRRNLARRATSRAIALDPEPHRGLSAESIDATARYFPISAQYRSVTLVRVGPVWRVWARLWKKVYESF